MTIFARNKAHHKNLSTSVIPLVCSMSQNKATNEDDIVSVLDCADGNLSKVESSDSDD
jgi:hypothetical protein